MQVPDDVRGYLKRLVEQLTGVLDHRLLGAYALGGLALGDYRSGSSDIDVYVVVTSRLERELSLAVARACGHQALPCPAKRLELVVLSAAAAGSGSTPVRWELNLNTGAEEQDHVGLDPLREPSHWFTLDLALAQQHAVALVGPAAHTLIKPPPAADISAAHVQAVAWYAEHQMFREGVLAACRAWHWHETGRFAGKRQALRWAAPRL